MAGRVGGEDDPEGGESVVLGVGVMMTAGGVPQWKRDLLRRRRQAANTSHSSARPALVDMLLRDDANDANHLETTPDEELKYGPGIVKKLKSRYLSLTLRESSIKSRPSINGLRRAASLEHGLDEEPLPPARKFQPKNDVITTGRPTRYRQERRNLEAAKRARSVDALVRCDSRSENEEILPISPIEVSPPMDKTVRPKRPSPLLKETERPPPDLVKTTLKIFECRNGKRSKNNNPPTGQVADKVKSFTDQVKAKRAGPKPTIPPRGPGLLLSPDSKGNTCATQTTPSLLTKQPPSYMKSVSEIIKCRDRSLSPVYVNKHPVILAQVESPKSEYPPVRGFSPLVPHHDNSPLLSPGFSPDRLSANGNKRQDNDSNLYIRTSTPDPDVALRPATTEISLISPTSLKDTKTNSARKISDASSSSDISDEAVFEVNGSPDEPPATKQVTKSVIENIAKAGTTTHFSFNGSMGNGQSNKSYLPSPKTPVVSKVKAKPVEEDVKQPSKPEIVSPTYPVAAVNAKILMPLSSLIIPEPYPGESSEKSVLITTPKRDIVIPALKTPVSPPKIKDIAQVLSIDSSPALVHYNSPSPTTLTSREIEKNLINTSKSLEQPLKKVVVTMVDSNSIQKDPIVVKEDIKKTVKEESKKTVKEESAKKIVIEEPKRVIVKENVVVVKTKESNIGGSVNSVLVSEVKNVSPSSGVNGFSRLTGKRPDRQQSQNSTVYDFSKRKEVPDYVENDGVILRTSMRDKPRPQPECRVSLRGDVSGGESCTDGFDDSFEDGDFDYPGDEWTAGPPSPCDVDFENANVLINGRSNMSVGAKNRAKLKIQFDDTLTQTFEYPSEASMGEDLTNITASPVANPTPLGGCFSTYTPLKVQLQVDSYQLGVTKSSASATPSTNGQKASDNDAITTNGDVAGNLNDSSTELCNSGITKSLHNNGEEEEDYLKPCQEAESHNWSHETHLGAGDLLF